MSEENVAIVREAFRRWLDGGPSAESIPIDFYAEDVEWDLSGYPLVDWETRGTGRDALFHNFVEYFSGWQEYRAEATEITDAGDDVLVVLHEKASIAGSDVTAERDVFHVYTLRDSRVSRWRIFATREEAQEAAGL